MKKLLILFAFLLQLSSIKAQVTVDRAGAANTVQDGRLAAKYNFLLPRYYDTIAANLNRGLDSIGAMIYTRVDSKVWLRVGVPSKKWFELATGGGGGGDTTRVSKIIADTTLKAKTFLSDFYLKGPFLQENQRTNISVGVPTTTNASSYLITPTYDGSGQAMHPDVYYNSNKWNGYKYWMAMTPYTGGNDLTENPSLLCSNDGVTWSVPPGVTNPIAPAPPSTQFQADAEIIPPGAYDKKLRVIYRRTIERTTDSSSIYSRAYDGTTVSSEINIIPNIRDSVVSPCVIEKNGVYTMYYTNIYTTPYSLQKRTATNPDGPWSDAINCTLTNPTGMDIWHVNANYIGDQITLWATMCTAGTSGLGAKLYYANSDDGTNFTIASGALLSHSASNWDNSEIYRSCAILLDGGTKRYGLFYSADNASTVWHTGYTEVSLSESNSASWKLTGNSGVSSTSNFIGTTDSQSVRFRTSNVERMILDNLGNFKYSAGKSWGNIDNNYTPANPSATGLQNNYLYLFYNPAASSRWSIGLNAATNMSFQNNGAQGWDFYQGATKVAAGINTSGNFQQSGGFYGFDPNSSGLTDPTSTNQSYTYSLYNNTANPSKIGIAGVRAGLYDMYFQALNGGFRWYKGTTELGSISQAGNLLLNTTTDVVNSILTLNSTTKGVLIPRMTTTNRDAIASPDPMLQVSNTTTSTSNTYNSVNWTGGLVVSSAGTLTLKHGEDYIFTGTTSTWTLPAVSATILGRQNGIKIKNRGSGTITMNSNAGSTIYTTSAIGTINIVAGAAVELLPDGTYFNVIFNL